MKLYDCRTAPSPRRVRIFLAEKGLAVETVEVDLRGGAQLAPAFRAINPECTVPVLELDDGTRLTDAVAICRYLEETHPEPPLLGSGPKERALVEEWQRRVERDGFYAAMEAFRNWARGFKDRALPGPDDYAQIPELATRGRQRLDRFFAAIDARLGAARYVAGARFSIADITLLVTIDFAAWAKVPVPEERNLQRWLAETRARPSATA